MVPRLTNSTLSNDRRCIWTIEKTFKQFRNGLISGIKRTNIEVVSVFENNTCKDFFR